MAVISNTGTVTPNGSVEQDVASIAPGLPLDNLSVYVIGGTGGAGPLEFALYATVGGFRTRVAQAKIMGDNTPSLIDWQTGIGPLGGGSGGNGHAEQVDAGGTAYTVTVIDLGANTGTRNPVIVTIAAVDSFDTSPDANFGAIFSLAPGATGTLPVFAGYAQLMDVAIDQTNLPSVTVSVTADCGTSPASVLGTIVESVNMSGKDETVASVFRGIKLPVATRYFVSVTNNSQNSLSVTLTGVTYSVSVTSGGVVTLGGDVIGPSNANTVIKWDNVPLDLVSMGTPTGGDVPQFLAGAWSAVPISTAVGALSPDVVGTIGANEVVQWAHIPLDLVTMSTPAVNSVPTFIGGEWVAAAAGAVALTGNVNGPSTANRFLSLTLLGNDANVSVTEVEGWWWVRINGLTADRTVTLPAAPTNGEVVVVKDGDGSLGGPTPHNIDIDPGANTIDGVAGIYTMTAAQNGVKGSVNLQFDSAAPNPGWFFF